MVAWEIEVRRDPTSPVLVNAGIVHFPESHADVGTAPILESRINAGPVHVHVHTNMSIEVWIPQRSDNYTTLPWML